MKKFFITKIFIFSLPVILLSCEALPINYNSSESWLIPQEALEKNRNTINITDIQVDRSGGWDSVEREITALAPLYFWNNGCMVVTAEEKPVYTAEIQTREREFNHGWSTKRSLSVEVRIWTNTIESDNSSYEEKLPMAVGRVVETGEKSFASSETTGQLLSKAIKKAVNELSTYERLKLAAIEEEQRKQNKQISKKSKDDK